MREYPNSAKPRRRALALVLAVGALALLLIITVTSTQAYVAKVGETTLTDFASGEFYRTSLLEIPPDIDSVQLVPVGLSGQWGVDPNSLPVALTELAAVAGRNAAADKGHIVVMGGFDASFNYHDEVYVSALNADGSLSPWVEQTGAPLPQPLAAAAAAIYPRNANSSWVYLLGGTTAGGNSLGDVYYTILDHDTGSISPWITNTYPLSMPVYYEGVTAHNGYVYVVGGYWVEPPFLPEVLNTVYYAQIQPNGSLGEWQEAPVLPEPLSTLLVVAYSEGVTNTLYVIGGWDRTGGPANSSYRVYFADIDPDDGSLTPWIESGGSLPAQIYAHSGAQVNGQIIVTGGRDATNTISDTVKAALIDPGNPNFRLYDWCRGVPPPTCTIGAWQSGPILPEPRAFHVTVDSGGFIYTMGGVGPNGQPSDVVYWGSTNGLGALYSPWGHYTSSEFDFGRPTILRKVEWDTSIAFPSNQTLKLRYRYKPQGGDWQPWSAQEDSENGLNVWPFDPPIDNVRLFQYRVDLTTNMTDSSPLLNWIDVYYEVDDPEVAVHKDSGDVITVSEDSLVDYTLYFTNSGGWVAENVVLTETLPANTTYAGGPEWHQIGASNLYTYAVGNLNSNTSAEATFQVRINDQVPSGTLYITNIVEIDYPPMIDAMGQIIVDPQPANNSFEFHNPFVPYSVHLLKKSTPPSGSAVAPGETISYTLIYSNGEWSIPANNTYILDTLPDYTNYVPGSIYGLGADDSNLPELRWDLGDLEPGTRSQVGYAVTASEPPTDVLNIHNMATIYSDDGSPKDSNLVSHSIYRPVAVLEVTKDAWPTPGSSVAPGALITYTVLYTNSGLADAVDATVTEWYDPHDSYTVTAFLTGEPDEGNNQWYVGPLAPDQGGSIQFVVQVDDIIPNNWVITNSVTFESPEANVPANAVVTHVISYSATLPDLVVTDIGWQPANPKAGELAVFEVTIANWGIQDADDWFGVELYVKQAPSSAPSGPSDHDEGYCLNGCIITRTNYFRWAQQAQETSQVIHFEMDQAPFQGGGLYDVYAQVDVAFEGPEWNEHWGKYPEIHEDNNIHHETVWIPPVVYLPIVQKN